MNGSRLTKLLYLFVAAGVASAWGPAVAQQPCPPMHCQMIRAGEIEAVVGDGAGHRTRPGLWMMSSIKHQFSIFKNLSSGMLSGEFRSRANTVLEYVDDTTSLLKREPTDDYPAKSRMIYRARSPYYLDTELTIHDAVDFISTRPKEGNERQVAFNCYVNSPEDIRIHFLSGGQWERWIPAEHAGPGSSIAPAYLKDSELEVWPQNDDPRFHWYKRYEKRFDEPFYYGRFGKMVFILVFDKPKWIRFYLSPSGGGVSMIAGQTSPAWDFEWLIPREEYQANRDYTFRTCIVYKEFEGDEDVIREVKKVQHDLGYETVESLKKN